MLFQIAKLYALLLLSTIASGLQAQEQYVLKGFMGVQGGESFTYRLELHDSLPNIMAGYAYTYLHEKNDVKAAVTAVIDAVKKTIYLREHTILYNNYFASKALICLVQAQLVYDEKDKMLSGPLNTNTAGNDAACSKGSISFAHAAEVTPLFRPKAAPAPAPPAVTVTPPKSPQPKRRIVVDTLPPPATVQNKIIPLQPDNITEGKDKSYTWESDQVLLEIWDDNTVDNDRITLKYNGTDMLTNYSLTKEKKKLALPIGGNELNIIRIEANNEGNDPPNTAMILLTDGDKTYQIVAHNKTGKSALIRIKKKK